MKDTVLVVDDNPFERGLVVQALTSRGPDYEVAVADSAEQALQMVRERVPSAILMDCRLPGMSGIDALRSLRSSGHVFPVVMCTAEDARESVLEALRAGATDYLIKDRNFQQLVPLAVEKALNVFHLEQEKTAILERLRQSKDRYERLVVNAHEILFQADQKGRFLYINDAVRREIDKDAEEFYENPELVCQLLHPEDRERVRAEWKRLLERGGEIRFEMRVTGGGLRTTWFRVHAYSVPNAAGHGSFIVQGSAHNVTDSRELERQLAREKAQLEDANSRLLEVNRLKNEFVASVSHELRTPMNSIIGYTDCLLDGLDGPLSTDQAQSLTRVRKNAAQLLNLLNDILDMAKIEAGKMQLNPEVFDMVETCRDVMSVAQPLTRDTEIRLVTELPETLQVKADYDKVRRVLLNLLSNAVKFTKVGHVKLTARPHPSIAGAVKVEVEDTGIGIKPEDIPIIFDDFRQVDGSHTRQFSGTGLGLSITKKLVELHNGQIWVKSEPGVGSTFHVMLPIVYESKVEVPEQVDQLLDLQDEVLGPEQKVVLVVDRQVDMLKMAKKVLVAEGYHVVGTSDPDEALRHARELSPLAIVLDPSLQRSRGTSLVDSLKNDELTRSIPLLIVTLENDPALVMSVGAVDCLQKPVDVKELVQKVREVEAGRRQPSIVVVDDEPDVLQLYEDMLRINGYTDIRRAVNGAEALSLIREKTPDLVLMDLTMPVMDGFDAIARLREEPGWRDLPIIVVTGRVLTSSEEAFLHKHVRKVVTKQAIERKMLATGLRDILSDVRRAE